MFLPFDSINVRLTKPFITEYGFFTVGHKFYVKEVYRRWHNAKTVYVDYFILTDNGKRQIWITLQDFYECFEFVVDVPKELAE